MSEFKGGDVHDHTDINKEQEIQTKLAQYKSELQEYGLRGLEGRMQHGLDPAAMMALSEVRSCVEKVATAVKADMAKLDELTKALHVGAVWKEAPRLAEAKDPEAVAWHVLAALCVERNVEGEELDDAGFLADVERVVAGLEATASDQEKVRAAVEANTSGARDAFQMVDGVAFAQGEYPFLKMAIAGETSGVWKDGDLLFVASDALDFDGLANKGFTRTEREDRGRMVTFWQKDGVDVVKQLGPGFGIVFGGDQTLALEIAKSGQK